MVLKKNDISSTTFFSRLIRNDKVAIGGKCETLRLFEKRRINFISIFYRMVFVQNNKGMVDRCNDVQLTCQGMNGRRRRFEPCIVVPKLRSYFWSFNSKRRGKRIVWRIEGPTSDFLFFIVFAVFADQDQLAQGAIIKQRLKFIFGSLWYGKRLEWYWITGRELKFFNYAFAFQDKKRAVDTSNIFIIASRRKFPSFNL